MCRPTPSVPAPGMASTKPVDSNQSRHKLSIIENYSHLILRGLTPDCSNHVSARKPDPANRSPIQRAPWLVAGLAAQETGQRLRFGGSCARHLCACHGLGQHAASGSVTPASDPDREWPGHRFVPPPPDRSGISGCHRAAAGSESAFRRDPGCGGGGPDRDRRYPARPVRKGAPGLAAMQSGRTELSGNRRVSPRFGVVGRKVHRCRTTGLLPGNV